MGSEFASDGNEIGYFPISSDWDFLGFGMAPGLFNQPILEDINSAVAGSFSKRSGCSDSRFGGISMQLKLLVLIASSIALWLTPLTALDKKVSWHKAIQGLSLVAGITCAVSAGNIARKLAPELEIELIKERAITADIIDEIGTSAYVSQTQRQQEAEQMLNPREHLERALALTYSDEDESEPIAQKQLAEPDAERSENERAERALQLKAKGWGKAKIILELWGVSKGGSEKYKAAEAEYKRSVGDK